jgi:hypothetical protein
VFGKRGSFWGGGFQFVGSIFDISVWWGLQVFSKRGGLGVGDSKFLGPICEGSVW